MNKLIKKYLLTEKPLYRDKDDFIHKTCFKTIQNCMKLKYRFVNNKINRKILLKNLKNELGKEFTIECQNSCSDNNDFWFILEVHYDDVIDTFAFYAGGISSDNWRYRGLFLSKRLK